MHVHQPERKEEEPTECECCGHTWLWIGLGSLLVIMGFVFGDRYLRTREGTCLDIIKNCTDTCVAFRDFSGYTVAITMDSPIPSDFPHECWNIGETKATA